MGLGAGLGFGQMMAGSMGASLGGGQQQAGGAKGGAATEDAVETLKTLKEMLASDLITEEEYNSKKKEILDSM